ncbi:MAG: hypothetical protein BRD23_01210 [Halobacteriales archaeon SW_9_67_25]|jgi:hypothetical protein|nr:MAG: hypothetical protein BRD23_01210 [Halobacteriales archaeon SW_9_67_25]
MSRSTVTLPTPPDSRTPRQVLEPLGFWAAVVLPLGYLPLLYGGLTDGQATLFLGLLALNVVCLVLGREYRRG